MKQWKQIIAMLLCVAMLLPLTACGHQELKSDTSEAAHLKVRVIQKEMTTESEGTATLEVEIPDYESIFRQAKNEEDPDKSFYEMLEKGEFPGSTETITAAVRVVDGQETILFEDPVKDLLEIRLIEALNALEKEDQTK